MTVQVSKERGTSFDQSQTRFLSDFEAFEKNGAAREPSWIRQIRRAAITRFGELGFPTTQHEEWKYTSVAPIATLRFTRAEHAVNGLTADSLRHVTLGESAAAQLVFVNGVYSPALSFLLPLPNGVRVGSLKAALSTHPAEIEPHLARYAGYRDHPFVALNTAFMEDGAFVYVPKGKVVNEPIHLVFVSAQDGPASTGLRTGLLRRGSAQASTGLSTGFDAPQDRPFDRAQDRRQVATVSHPRNLIVADDGSQATIVETYVGLDHEVCFTNAVTEIVAGESAVVAHHKLQQESEAAIHVATVQAWLTRNGNFRSHSIALGGGLVRNDVNAVLDGAGIECSLDGLYMVGGRQHVDNHTRIDHVKPHCSSRELYKGILDGNSRGVFNGKIYVHKDAQKTDAKQTNKNLLLSEDAVIDTKPQLEIFADDVKCTHGSTIGQLDQDAIFYMRSRGLDLPTARSLLTYAFASEMIGRVRIEPMRVRLECLLISKLQRGSQAEGTP